MGRYAREHPGKYPVARVLIILFMLGMLSAPAIAATTQLRVVRVAGDGSTVLNETTVTYQWMRDNLPVLGDGVTHYYQQGPVFVDDPDPAKEEELRWNPAEDTNVQEKDAGAVRGTNLKDLCDLAGGIADGETVEVRAVDRFSRTFAYRNVYDYSPREGPMVITWYQNGNYPDSVSPYRDGMRLVWFADSSTNPWGIHAFGNQDWHEAADPEYWYYYQDGAEKYPTTTGLSAKYVNEIRLLTDDEAAGDIRVTSSPLGAAISVDGSETGIMTNGTVTGLDLGSHTVAVALDGYREATEQEAVARWGVPAVLHFNLIRMEGSVKISSTPPGAKVYLDGTDTRNVTPCTVRGIAPGDHTITAKLSGYADTSETVTVEDGGTVDLDLDLATQDSGPGLGVGDTGSSDAGGSLVTVVQGRVNGGVILATTAGSPRKLARMATATGLIAVDLPLNATVTRARLLVFTTGEPSPAGAAPGMGDPVVSLGEGPLTPSASYRDCLPGATGCPALQTLSFDLRGWQPPAGGVRVTVKHPGGQAVPFAWDGAAIVAAYEREGDPRTDYWISEGADGVLRDPDAALPDSEARTLADFPGEVNRSLAREAFFIPVSTVPEGGQGDGHLVIFNGNEWVSPLSGEGVWSARLDVRPYLRSAGNRAVVESAGISGRGDLLANRMWILVVTSGNDTPLEEAGETGSPVVPVLNAPLSIVPPTGTGTMETLEPPGNPATTVYKGNPGGEEQASTPVPGAEGIAGNVTLLDQILRIITSFFQWNGGTGENTGPVFTPSPTPAVPPGPATELVGSPFILPEANQSIGEEVLPCYNLTVTSSPDRALVSLDGAYLSKVTPVNLTCVARGVHELKLEKDDFREAVIPLDLTEHTTVHEDLTSVYTAYGSTLRTYTELTGGTADRCGGVFVASSMGKARVLLDGKDTGLFTDTVLSGLKPGLHTIRIRPEKNEFPDSTRQVWVYPSIISMVRFESSPPLKREVTVESPELRKAEFTVNGRYPSFRIPRKVTLDSWESYITVRENGTYTSFPTHAVDYNGTLIVRRPDPPLLTTVEVRSDPRGADILIDGFPTGLNTPATVRNLSPGNHRVLVSAPGFLPQERAILQEDLKGDGPDTVLGFFLESYAYGSLEVTSTPPGARIFLFQRDTGEKTPHVFPSLVIGTYDVKLENGEDSRTIYGVTVTPFGFTSRHVNLSVG